MAKTLHIQKYLCPNCRRGFSCEEWSEERPKEEVLCDDCQDDITPVNISTPFVPSWKKYEADMWNTDTKHSRKAADRFDMERAHEIKTDPRARRWEQGRKAAWAKDKPYWVKKQGGQ